VNNQALQTRMLSTYNSMRFGMFAIAAAAPVVIVLWGFIFGVSWQNSISAYYFAPLADSADKLVYSIYPGRVLFVGILFALGSFLYLYKGFSKREDVSLNFAGLFALGVALCPMYYEADYIPFSNRLHFGFAILLFICMAYTAIFCHDDTLRWVADPNRRLRYKVAYHVIGWFMGCFLWWALSWPYYLMPCIDRSIGSRRRNLGVRRLLVHEEPRTRGIATGDESSNRKATAPTFLTTAVIAVAVSPQLPELHNWQLLSSVNF